jgi:hypothetical protein
MPREPEGGVIVRLRTGVAITALATLGGLIVASRTSGQPVSNDRFVVAMWVLLAPLLITMIGLVCGAYWSRWLGVAAGIAVLPWASVFALAGGLGVPIMRSRVALAASVLVILSLLGRGMFERFEGRAARVDWGGHRMTLVRWTIICNIASILALYLFVAVYDARIAWHFMIPALLLLGLVLGVFALAHGKTAGLLAVALCCILFVPAGGYFVWQEARYAGEAILFIIVFLPGVLTGWASLFSFGGPIRRYLRGG